MRNHSYVLLSLLFASVAIAEGPAPSAQDILNKVLESDPWGLGGASISAHAVLTDKSGGKSDLSFTSRSKRLGPGLSESVVRFSTPPDLAGAGFLQVQKREGDDDRFLFLPELKRSRRISGALRSNAFMGTDLTFADLDRRDLRDSTPKLVRTETVEKWECFVLDVISKRTDSQYARTELWVRTDNYVPLKMKLYDKSSVLLKTFTTLEIKRVSGAWFITKSRMVNHQQNHTTDLFLDQVSTAEQIPDDEFTVRALEKSL